MNICQIFSNTDDSEILYQSSIILLQLSKLGKFLKKLILVRHRSTLSQNMMIFNILRVMNIYQEDKKIIEVVIKLFQIMCISPDNANLLMDSHIALIMELLKKNEKMSIRMDLIKVIYRLSELGFSYQLKNIRQIISGIEGNDPSMDIV